MNPYVTLSLVDYIQLLHSGRLEKPLFAFYAEELKTCTPFAVAVALDNLIIRYRNIEDVEATISRFIHAAAKGLDSYEQPVFAQESILRELAGETAEIRAQLSKLKRVYKQSLPDLKSGDTAAKSALRREIEALESLKAHYLKLQNELFPALEAAGAPALCTRLMWYLQDAIWPRKRECLLLMDADQWEWDYNRFNSSYGQLFFRISSLLYREERILFPVASKFM